MAMRVLVADPWFAATLLPILRGAHRSYVSDSARVSMNRLYGVTV